MRHRSYNQYCGLAYALYFWQTLDTVDFPRIDSRPHGFTDLMDGLPGISTHLLTERLKSLEQQGILSRRVLPPPAGPTVYELPPLSQALEKTLLALG